MHNYNDLISMHFRLGDYVNKQNYHPVMEIEYYKKSIQHIIDTTKKQNLKILYFCEKEDIQQVNVVIEQLHVLFTECKFIRVNNNIEDWEQMIMMSLCQHNIIANSTFSWWGAYFNTNSNKIVCYPEVWFGPALYKSSVKDLCPNSWCKITC